MSSGANGEWVRQGTPRDDNADWNEEQSEYGTAISPTEWDDYSSEQSVPVTPPRVHSEGGETHDPLIEADPMPGQEPDAEREYRSDEVDPLTVDEPFGDADDDGLEPARLDDDASSMARDDYSPGAESLHDTTSEDFDMGEQETTRPRPIVPEASATAVGDDDGAGYVTVEDDTQRVPETPAEELPTPQETHLDAADYLAVDPEPAPWVDTDSVAQHVDDEPTQYVDAVGVDDEPTQHVDTVGGDDEPTQYVDAVGVDDEPTQHVDTVGGDDEPTQHVDTVGGDDEPTQYVDTLGGDDEPTQHVDTDDMEATQAVPVTAAGATAADAGTVPDSLYRSAGTEETTVITQEDYPHNDADVEEERLQAQLEAERQAREQRLGAVPTSTDNALREDAGPPRITTDRFLPSLGLFVMRIVLAGVLGLASFQILGSGVDATDNFLNGYPVIPEPRLVAWILGFTLGAMALLLIIGLLQRLVGFLLLVISVATLVFIRWGNFAIFSSGDLWVDGFIGDKDLLLAATGLLLMSVGGGAWGVDGAFRRARAAAKAERQG